MPNRRRAMLLAAVCSASLVVVPVAQAETLVGALTAAYENNPQLQQARITQRQSDESYYRALINQFSPGNVTLTLSQSVNADLIDNVAPATFGTISFTQRLTTGGVLNRALTLNDMTLLQARDRLRQAEQTAMQTAISNYIQVLSQELNLKIQLAGLRTSQKNADNVQAQYDVGTKIYTEVADARVALLGRQLQYQAAQNTLAQAKGAYAIAIGHMPDDNFEAPPDLPNLPASYEEALQLAFQWGTTWRSAVYADRTAEINLASAKVGVRPTVNASVNYGTGLGGKLRLDAFSEIPNRDSLSVSLSASIPLWTWGVNASTLRSAEDTRTAARLTLDQARKNLIQNTQNTWNNLVNSRASIQNAKLSLENQNVAIRGKRVQFSLGGITSFEMLSAEDVLRGQQQQFVNSLTSLYTNEVNMLFQLGLLDPHYLIPNVTPSDPLADFERLKSKFVIVPYAKALTAVDSLFAPKLPPPPEGAELPSQDVNKADPLPALKTMNPKPSAETAEAFDIKLVPDELPPPLPMIPMPVFEAMATPLDDIGPPAGGRGAAPAGGGRGGGGGGFGGGGGR